jgi:transcriptional regulator with XRE-family HTH domain
MKNKNRWQGGALMYTKLSIPERLKDLRVVDKHLTLEQLAEQTGLSKSALGKYEGDDYKDISPFAIATLAEFYGVSTDYLMGLSENKTIPNSDLQSLHLSDEMIELLRSGRINNRLLCELATHEGFPRLMTDITVIVDRIAGCTLRRILLHVPVERFIPFRQ